MHSLAVYIEKIKEIEVVDVKNIKALSFYTDTLGVN